MLMYVYRLAKQNFLQKSLKNKKVINNKENEQYHVMEVNLIVIILSIIYQIKQAYFFSSSFSTLLHFSSAFLTESEHTVGGRQ